MVRKKLTGTKVCKCDKCNKYTKHSLFNRADKSYRCNVCGHIKRRCEL